MSASGLALLGVFGTTDFLMPLVLQDLTNEQARHRARGEAGPSIGWTVGHLLHHRHQAMALLGHAEPDPYADRFGRQGATNGHDYPSVAEQLRLWQQMSERFVATLREQTDQALEAPAGAGAHGEQTVRDKLAFLAWHEGYHLGVIGGIRKALGLPGPAERVLTQG